MNLMKTICLSLALPFFVPQALAKDIRGGYSFNSYDQAADSDSQLKLSFQVGVGGENSQNVTSLARSFQYQAHYDEQGHALAGIELNVDSSLMDSNDKVRDKQFHSLCMPSGLQREIKVSIEGPANFSEEGEKEYTGVTTMRGKAYKTPVKMRIHFDQETEQMILVGSFSWPLKDMGASDSCFKEAKVSDSLKLDFQLIIKMNEAAY